ncbi:MAG: RNA polymerase sigma-70 factor [Candidatus Limnocylindria bacterium]
MNDGVDDFQQLRPALLGLAYRMLGSMWDAQDVVQDAWLKWTRTDRAEVREPRAFLMTAVSRLAIDHLRLARVKRESYRGPWLPEPVATDALGPMDTVELRDTVSFATLTMMERLSPNERAVFVLREAFDVPYSDIAKVVDTSQQACRQLYSRAKRHLATRDARYRPSDHEVTTLLTNFMAAAQGGDLAALSSMLADDVTAWNDGGGKVRAATKAIVGRDRVLAFIRGLLSRYPLRDVRIVQANGQAAARLSFDGNPQFLAIDVDDGRIQGLYAVLNPDKLMRFSEPSSDVREAP